MPDPISWPKFKSLDTARDLTIKWTSRIVFELGLILNGLQNVLASLISSLIGKKNKLYFKQFRKFISLFIDRFEQKYKRISQGNWFSCPMFDFSWKKYFWDHLITTCKRMNQLWELGTVEISPKSIQLVRDTLQLHKKKEIKSYCLKFEHWWLAQWHDWPRGTCSSKLPIRMVLG